MTTLTLDVTPQFPRSDWSYSAGTGLTATTDSINRSVAYSLDLDALPTGTPVNGSDFRIFVDASGTHKKELAADLAFSGLAQAAAYTLLGNPTAGTADLQAVTLTASDLIFSGTALTLANTSVTAATYTNPTLTIDAKGRISVASNGVASLPRGYLAGLAISNGTDATNDIDIGAGTCRDSTNTADMTVTALTKQLDAAWAVGTAAGGLDTGSIANAWYHIYVIKRVDTGVTDVIFSTNATSPTLPTNYTLFRRIHSFLRTGGAIKAFKQFGDKILWTTPVADVTGGTIGTASASQTLNTPLGVKVQPLINYYGSKAATLITIFARSPDVADIAPNSAQAETLSSVSLAAGEITSQYSSHQILQTGTSSEVYFRSSAASTVFYCATFGWVDRRGRDD